MTKILRVVLSSFLALRRNVLRSALTVLGIVIGVAAVIAMMEIGNGVTKVVQKTIASLGSNVLMVLPGASASGGISFGAGSTLTLTPGDADAIAKECPSVSAVAPVVRMRAGQLVHGGRNWVPVESLGTTPDLLTVRDWQLSDGEPFTRRDVSNAACVCLIGQTVAKELFGAEEPVGQEIRVQNVGVRVVGILDKKGSDVMGRDQDDTILLPWTTVKFRISGASSGGSGGAGASSAAPPSASASNHQVYPGSSRGTYPAAAATRAQNSPMPVRFVNVDQIRVSADSPEDMDSAMAEMTALLHERHRIGQGEPDDFNIRNLTEMVAAQSSLTDLMTTMLLVLAMISLLVGGVGIMNIMLVSVTERTKEIGLRMAVGARAGDILHQFLAEAVVLCLSGGVLGIMLGRACSQVVASVLGWAVEPSFGAIVAAVAVSSGIGVVFGFYPAWKASRLDPIEALRYE